MSDLPQVSPAGSKMCSKCRELKDPSEFHKDRSKRDGLRSVCRACTNASRLGRRPRTPEEQADKNLRYNFGITLREYDQLLEAQGGGCAICSKTPAENGKRLAVDHNHQTGEIRGLLCGPCNHALGLLKDSPRITRLAAQYLEERGHYASD